jgi:hypothetical protein
MDLVPLLLHHADGAAFQSGILMPVPNPIAPPEVMVTSMFPSSLVFAVNDKGRRSTVTMKVKTPSLSRTIL